MGAERGGVRNAGRVVRNGDRLLRPLGPTSAPVQALLLHLASAGFPGAPRHLGDAGDGREALSWVDGVTYPGDAPGWARSPTTLRAVAALVRRFHDAAGGARLPPWQPLCPPPVELRGNQVCHGDLGVGNVVFSATTPVALIDFEFVVLADSLYDVATVASVWPELPPIAPDDDEGRSRFDACVTAVADGYGLSRDERRRLPAAMVAVERNAIDFMIALADAGDPVATANDFVGLARARLPRLAWLQAVAPALAERLLATRRGQRRTFQPSMTTRSRSNIARARTNGRE